MRYVLGETLQEYQEEIMEKDRPSVFLAHIIFLDALSYPAFQRLPGTGRHAV